MKRWIQYRNGQILTSILVILVLSGLLALGYTLATTYEEDAFTEFYILGPDGTAESYISNLTVGQEGNLITGIVNREGTKTSYRIEIIASGERVAEIGPITLADNETWEDTAIWTAEVAGENQKFEFFLYKDGDTQPSLEPLHLWVDVDEVNDAIG